jgi:hypothetical protein
MSVELIDLRKANDHAARRRVRQQKVEQMRQRSAMRRNRRRQLDLLVAGVCKGWLR